MSRADVHPESWPNVSRGGVVALVALTALGAALRWAEPADSWATLAGLGAGLAAVPLVMAALAERGLSVAGATGLLVATSPWLVHVTRAFDRDAGAPLAFLAAALLGVALAATSFERRLLLVAAAIGILLSLRSIATNATLAPTLWRRLLGDVGVALPLLLLFALRRGGGIRRLVTSAMVAGAVADFATTTEQRLAAALAPLLLIAGEELGRWIGATGSWRARGAFAALAVIPTLPALIGEWQDGGRYELAPLAAVFAKARAPGEPLYASDPAAAARAFKVAARPLAEAIEPGTLPLADRAVFVLLCEENGDAQGAADLEAQGEALGHTGRKRLDLRRFEARLYRIPPAAPAVEPGR